MVSYTTGVCTSQDPGAARIIFCPIVEPFPPWECIGCQPNCFFFGIDLDAVCWSGMLSIEVFGVIPMTIHVADVQWNAKCRGWANAQRTATKTRTTRHGQTCANFNHYFDALSYLSSALPVQHLYHDTRRGFAVLVGGVLLCIGLNRTHVFSTVQTNCHNFGQKPNASTHKVSRQPLLGPGCPG